MKNKVSSSSRKYLLSIVWFHEIFCLERRPVFLFLQLGGDLFLLQWIIGIQTFFNVFGKVHTDLTGPPTAKTQI